MLKISRESEINLINILIDQDVIKVMPLVRNSKARARARAAAARATTRRGKTIPRAIRKACKAFRTDECHTCAAL